MTKPTFRDLLKEAKKIEHLEILTRSEDAILNLLEQIIQRLIDLDIEDHHLE